MNSRQEFGKALSMAGRKKAFVGADCVACGTCISACPAEAAAVPFGVRARVDGEKCVGCGRCARACPAGVILMIEREGGAEEAENG